MTPASPETPSYGSLARFFVPLALQAASQGLTYPLVAMVASRGQGGPLNLAGLAQSNTILFMLGTLGFGLVATGMVYGKNREGFAQFRAVTLLLAALSVAVQLLFCIPAAATLLFENWIGLPPSIARPAHLTLLASAPLQFLFFLRIPYQVSMYNGLAAGRASMATLMRILITALLAPLFSYLGAVGPIWAVVCLTIPVALEVLASAILARPFLAELKPSGTPPPKKKELIFFNLPLSTGGYLLSLSGILLGAFIARAPHPEVMLPAYYLALGLATPMAFGATRIQEVVLTFHPRQGREPRVLRFAAAAGFLLGTVPLLFILPGPAEFYYVRLQNLSPDHLPIVRATALWLVLFPMCVAIRAHGEGLAGLARRTATVIAGQTAFLLMVLASAGAALWAGAPGHLIGATGLSLGNLASTAAVRALLHRLKQRPLPVAPTSTCCGPPTPEISTKDKMSE
jgi:hypothetical protein